MARAAGTPPHCAAAIPSKSRRCPAPQRATCTAGGSYDTTNSGQCFVIAETGGLWGHPRPLPGLATLNTARGAGINAISCPTTGHCTAVGYYYYGRAGQTRAFAATQT